MQSRSRQRLCVRAALKDQFDQNVDHYATLQVRRNKKQYRDLAVRKSIALHDRLRARAGLTGLVRAY